MGLSQLLDWRWTCYLYVLLFVNCLNYLNEVDRRRNVENEQKKIIQEYIYIYINIIRHGKVQE